MPSSSSPLAHRGTSPQAGQLVQSVSQAWDPRGLAQCPHTQISCSLHRIIATLGCVSQGGADRTRMEGFLGGLSGKVHLIGGNLLAAEGGGKLVFP